jgi:hypothetical protein
VSTIRIENAAVRLALGFLLPACLYLQCGCKPQSNSEVPKQAASEQVPVQKPAREQSSEKAVAAIEQYCTKVQTRSGKREPDFVFGASGSSDDRQPQWRKFSSKAEFEKAFESEIPDDAAYVWIEEGKIVAANFTFQSGSGDWANHADYCFRRDETTARISSELRTFYGGMLVRRKWEMDSEGLLLKSTEEFLDLKTNTPKKPDGDFIDKTTPLYHKVAELPFLSLLDKREQRP